MSVTSDGSGYEVVPFARIREVVIDVMIPAQNKHTISILFEADVTDVRRRLKQARTEGGAGLSLTAYIIGCTAEAAMSNPRLTARRIGPRKLAIFDDVHVNCMVETEVDGQSHPVGKIVHRANRKSARQIHDELRSFSEEEKKEQVAALRNFAALPGRVRAGLLAATSKKPKTIIERVGTAMVTSVGMYGAGGGHVVPYTDFTLCIGVGGIARKPGIVLDRIEPREFLSLTAIFDHDIIDGAPAARFAQQLRELLEAGHGLDQRAAT
jgi:pyruvate/2-oxoglutarate dehydrogenase complex dihydrolipoamide acyltransferase (E2) component